jgi:hypothetical protein
MDLENAIWDMGQKGEVFDFIRPNLVDEMRGIGFDRWKMLSVHYTS